MDVASKTRPCLFFESEAEEAARFYVARLPDSRIENVVRAAPGGPPVAVEFTLAGAPYLGLNGNPGFVSTHSFSISVLTEDQPETDALWDALQEGGGEAGRCGWLKDRFGVHWQVVPKALPRLMSLGGEAGPRVQAALMEMGRIDIGALEAAAKEEA